MLGVIAEPFEEVGEDGKPLKRVRAGQGRRTAQEHAAFVAYHENALEGMEDEGLRAFLAFLKSWTPERFAELDWPTDMLDQNVVFRLDGGDGPRGFVHEREAAREAWARLSLSGAEAAACLATGRDGATARLHPSIKGVMGAQSSGASLVSFNLDAFTSQGKVQGDNAPVSAEAAFAYGTALNALLAKGSGRATRVGETMVAWWASTNAGDDAAETAESFLGTALFDADLNDAPAMREAMDRLSQGVGVEKLGAGLDPDTRIHVLGLAPNNARLSVRFWHVGSLGEFERHLAQHWHDFAIEPRRDTRMPPVWQLAQELIAHTPPQSAGGHWMRRANAKAPERLPAEMLQAILTGGRYPRTLLAAVLGRLRAEPGNLNPRRVAILKAVVNRLARFDAREAGTPPPASVTTELPVSLNETSQDLPYNLGRLFAAYVYAEASYIPRNATLRDKYAGAVSVNPRRVFPVLMRGYEHNRSALLKAGGQKAGSGVKADKAVSQILGQHDGDIPFPAVLPIEDQGRFFVGFYHQERAFYAGKAAPALDTDADDTPTEDAA